MFFYFLVLFCSYETVDFFNKGKHLRFLTLLQCTVSGVSIKRTKMFLTRKFEIAIFA